MEMSERGIMLTRSRRNEVERTSKKAEAEVFPL